MVHFKNIVSSFLFIGIFTVFSSQADLEINYSVQGINNSYESTVSGTTLGTLATDEEGLGLIVSVDYGPKYGSFIGVSGMYTSFDSVNFDVPGSASSSNPIDLTLFGLYPGIGYRFPLVDSLDMNLFTGVALNFIDAKMDYLGFNILDDSGWDISFHWKISLLYPLTSSGAIELGFQDLGSHEKLKYIPSAGGGNIESSMSGMLLGYKFTF